MKIITNQKNKSVTQKNTQTSVGSIFSFLLFFMLLVIFLLFSFQSTFANPSVIAAQEITSMDQNIFVEDFIDDGAQIIPDSSLVTKGLFLKVEGNAFFVDESIRVRILSEPESLRVTGPGISYKYLGVPTDPLVFTPSSEGEYSLIAQSVSKTDKNQIIEQKISFVVAAKRTHTDNSSVKNDSQTIVQSNELLPDQNILITIKDSQDRVLLSKTKSALKNSVAFDTLVSEKKRVKISLEPQDDLFSQLEIENVDVSTFNFRMNKPEISQEKIKNSLKKNPLTNSKNAEQRTSVGRVVSTYAIDPSGTNFTNGTLIKRAKGNALYKCATWDFDNEVCPGSWEFVQIIVPGENYVVAVDPQDPAYVETGVATINSEKPIYLPGENARLLSVVLDDKGYLVSDAQVILRVTDPSGSSTIIPVSEISKGIYEAYYSSTFQIGSYGLEVEALAQNTNITMSSEFLVQSSYPFEILRKTPITFDPWKGPFYDEIIVSPRIIIGGGSAISSFSFTENIPENYEILDADGGVVLSSPKRVVWENITNQTTFRILLKAPLLSPDLVSFSSNIVYGISTFDEARPWFVAVDPVSEWIVQGGTGHFTSSDSQIDIALNQTIQDTSQAFFLMDSSGPQAASNAAEHQATGYILNSTHVRFNRGVASADAYVSFYVVENTGGDIFVQRGEITTTGLSANATLSTAVNTSKSFVIVNTRTSANDGTSIHEGYGRSQLINNNTVDCIRLATGSTLTCRYQVIQINNPTMSVQTNVTTISSTTATATVPMPVNDSRSILFYSYSADTNGLSQTAVGAQLTSSTQVSLYRYATAGSNDVRWYVVELPNGTTVQRSTIDGSSDSSSLIATASISSVNLNRSFSIVGSTSSGTGNAFPRQRWINYLSSPTQLTVERYRNGQPYFQYWQVAQFPSANFIPNITTLHAPSSNTTQSNVDFNFTVIDDSSFLAACYLYLNSSGWSAVKNITDVQNNTQKNITYSLQDGSYLWNIQCRDYYGSSAFYVSNATTRVAAVANIQINSVDSNTTSPYFFSDQTPDINMTITNRNATCRISTFDESYATMVANGRVDCGSFIAGTSKICTYTTTLPINTQNLYVACNTTAGNAHNSSNNKDLSIDVLCTSHTACASTEYCDYAGDCSPDTLPGYNCYDLGVGGGAQNEVCGDGSNAFCVNDSSFSFTGWYCTADTNDCVYNDNGNSYDLNYELCISGTNDFRYCSASNMWGAIQDCPEQYDAYDQSATTNPGEYCGYYAIATTCVNDTGCSGSPTDCAGNIYNQTTLSCGTTLASCDLGCGAQCDNTNSTTAFIQTNVCYYDLSCSVACSWSQSTEIAPDFCIDDNDGGACAYSTRTNATQAETCYFTPTCANTLGAGLSSSGALRLDYCDICTASGNVNGGYAPEPNASCFSGCSNNGSIYYDSLETPTNRSDDCDGLGNSTIFEDFLTIGDVWNGSGPAYCEDVECNADCGTLVGVCSVGVCICTDEDYPLLELSSPLNDTWTNNPTVLFQYNVSDLSSGITNCSLLINGSIVSTNTTITELETQNFTQTFTNSSNSWSVLCYDSGSLNNANLSESRLIGVDTILPTISNPNRNFTTFSLNSPICLNATASDGLSGVNRVYAYVLTPQGYEEIDLYDTQTTSCDQTNGDGVYSVEYNVPYSGDYNLTAAYVFDRANNNFSVATNQFWNVSEGGNISATLDFPSTAIEINETLLNNNFTQSCTVTCVEGFLDCEDVAIHPEYNNGSDWFAITNLTVDLMSNLTEYSCGDLSATQAPWWNDSYDYRRQFRVSARSAIDTTHVIRIDYNMSGPKFQDDADDLRIVYWNGSENIEIDRQIFRPNESDTSIWFRLQTALAQNEKDYNYYIYYGNDTVTNPPENQSNIWLYYDDFTDGVYTDTWGLGSGTTAITSYSNPWSGTSNVLSVGGVCGSAHIKILPSVLPAIRDLHMRTLWMDNPGNVCTGGSPDADGVIGLHGSNSATYDGLLVERDTDTGFHYDIGATGAQTAPEDFSPFDVWQWSEVRAYGTSPSGYQAKYWLRDEHEPYSYRLTASAVTATSAGQPFLRVASGTAYVAVVMVRPAVDLEPTTQINPEEDENASLSNICSYNFTITSGNNSGNNVWPIRCVGTSTNSEYSYSSEQNLTINNNPYVFFDYPSSITWLANTQTLNASSSYDTDGSLVDFTFDYDNNSQFLSPTTICSGSNSTCSFNTLAQNQCVNNSLSCYLRITVRDDDGLTNSTYTIVGFDTQGPTTILDLPLNFTNSSANSLIVNASAYDAQVNVSAIIFEYRENASASWTQICVDFTSPYECTWNTTLLNDGNVYEIRAYANDTSANIGSADLHTNITLDKSGPQITLIDPINNLFTNTSLVNFTFSSNDFYSSLASCFLILDGVSNQTLSSPLELTTLNFTKTLAEGTHYWNITCVDTLSNTNVSETRNITIDTTGPVVLIDEPDLFEQIFGVSSTTVNATINDAGIGVIDTVIFDYRINSTQSWMNICSDTDGPPYSCSWDLTSLSDGVFYQVRARANDTLGNIGSYANNTNVTVDNNGPVVTTTLPANNSISGTDTIVFLYSAFDLGSNVTSCSLMWDGSLNQTQSGPLIEGQEYSFNLTNITNGNYTWEINCSDSFSQMGSSGVHNIQVDIRFVMNISVVTNATSYQVGDQFGDDVLIYTNATDFYGSSLASTTIYSDVVRVIETADDVPSWWDTSWSLRKPIFLSENSGSNRTNVAVSMTIDGLNGDISSCVNEIRIINSQGFDVSVNVVGGDDSTYCDIRFLANITANSINENNYFVYYDNPSATNPGYSTIPNNEYLLFIETFESGWTQITTTTPSTECVGLQGNFSNCSDLSSSTDHASTNSGTAVSGSRFLVMDQWRVFGATTGLFNVINAQTACGGDSCDDVRFTGYMATGSVDSSAEYCRVWARDSDTGTYTTVTECIGPDPACEFTDGSTGPSSISDYVLFNQTLVGDLGLTSSSFVALHIGGNLPGGADNCFYDDISMTGIREQAANVTNTTIGETQTFIQRNSSVTDVLGMWNNVFQTFSELTGTYAAVSLGEKINYSNDYAYFFFDLINDSEAPLVTLNSPSNNTQANSSVTFTYFVDDRLSSVQNCSLYIDEVYQDIDTQIEEGPVQFFFPRIPSGGPHLWNVLCVDSFGNQGWSENYTVVIVPPELVSTNGNITFSSSEPYYEGQNVQINTTIWNTGGSDTFINFSVELWRGNPLSGGVLVANQSINLTDQFGDHSNQTLFWNYTLQFPGPNTMYLLIDTPVSTNGSINETNETNNQILFNLTVPAYTIIYGNVSADVQLDNVQNKTFLNFSLQTNSTGLIYFADEDSSVSFSSLRALGRDIIDQSATSDFAEADALLNMTDFVDSVNNVWAQGNNTPLRTTTFTIAETSVSFVPVVNSSTTQSWDTGILWDSSYDTGNNEYDQTDSEPIVFVTQINKTSPGDYGIYDYQSKVPALLRDYAGSGGSTIYLYIELE